MQHKISFRRLPQRIRLYAADASVIGKINAQMVRRGETDDFQETAAFAAGKRLARQLGLERKTVRYWLRAGQLPERLVPQRHSSVDRWLSYLEKRWAEGCHNRSRLWRELQDRGVAFTAGTLHR